MIVITALRTSWILSSPRWLATDYKPAHASSSSGVSQSFDRAVSLNSMVSGICESLRCFIHATKSTTSPIQFAGSVSISCNKTTRFVILFLLWGNYSPYFFQRGIKTIGRFFSGRLGKFKTGGCSCRYLRRNLKMQEMVSRYCYRLFNRHGEIIA